MLSVTIFAFSLFIQLFLSSAFLLSEAEVEFYAFIERHML